MRSLPHLAAHVVLAGLVTTWTASPPGAGEAPSLLIELYGGKDLLVARRVPLADLKRGGAMQEVK